MKSYYLEKNGQARKTEKMFYQLIHQKMTREKKSEMHDTVYFIDCKYTSYY